MILNALQTIFNKYVKNISQMEIRAYICSVNETNIQ